MTLECLHTSYGIYKRGLYHSGSALVLILHERVRLLPQKAENLALKSLHGGTFGYKYRWATLQLCLPSDCTHHMGYIKEVCIIQEVPWYWYSTNESVYYPRKPKSCSEIRKTDASLAQKRMWNPKIMTPKCLHTSQGIQKRCLCADIPWMSPFTTKLGHFWQVSRTPTSTWHSEGTMWFSKKLVSIL